MQQLNGFDVSRVVDALRATRELDVNLTGAELHRALLRRPPSRQGLKAPRRDSLRPCADGQLERAWDMI